tara:strand:- start:71 stop:1486 length:1416 start_codon:yes stop_codon:yes gene_type:complete
MSEIKTNKISPRKGTTTTITDSGDTVTVSSGANINNAGNLTISNLTNSGTITSSGTLTTAGISGSGTINNTTGTITGLQGAVNWQTGSIKTASFTASANEGYFLNTTSGEITVTLPASPSAGDVVAVKDYADTFDTNKAILNPNGNKIQGSTENFQITVEGTAAILLYVDSTKGWLLVDQSKAADIDEKLVVATGGTVTTCGNFKIHTFTGPGTFCVSQGGLVDYLVVAGGGGAGFYGGGGAGGFRESHLCATSGPYTASPLATPSSLPVPANPYPISVGGGGPGAQNGTAGSNSVFSTITSAGGGFGVGGPSGGQTLAGSGGSGGGGGYNNLDGVGGSGNTPPVSPPQGNDGGDGNSVTGTGNYVGGGGGGATQAGTDATTPQAGPGGNGATTSISGSPSSYSGGGGAGYFPPSGSPSTGGTGGGGNGGRPGGGSNGTANTGGGGGANGENGQPVGSGGSGIVIIRYKFQ